MIKSALSRQRGAALVASLVLLMVITVVSLAAMRSSRLELRMANNAEAKQSAFQVAQAMVDAIFDRSGSIPILGAVGYKLCTASVPGCDSYDLDMDTSAFANELANNHLIGSVERIGTEEMPVPRGMETSADKYFGATFRIEARFDRTSDGQGRADVVEGILVLVPK